jgi:hypothetical protein
LVAGPLARKRPNYRCIQRRFSAPVRALHEKAFVVDGELEWSAVPDIDATESLDFERLDLPRSGGARINGLLNAGRGWITDCDIRGCETVDESLWQSLHVADFRVPQIGEQPP